VKAAAAKRSSKKQGPPLRDVLLGVGKAALAGMASPAAGRAFVACMVLAGFVGASWRARARVVDEPEARIDRRALLRLPLPAFLSDDARQDLARLDLPETVSAFHPGLVPTLALELSRVSWVDEVEQLSVDFEGKDCQPRLRVALKVARPIARMDERGMEVLVARSRRRIPQDRVVASARALPRIEGLPDDANREGALDEALSVVQALEKNDLGRRLGVVALQIAGREASLALVSGCRVEIGPCGALPGLPLDVRLAQLEVFLKRGPALDLVERISVRWDDPVYVLRPVAPVAARRVE
jgi:hypothetical protein